MNKRLMLGTLWAVVLFGLVAAAARGEGEGYIEFVSATPINYEGTPAWEYYYDVYSGGLGSASQIWFHGFDANELLNPLNQRWDSSAAAGHHFAWGDFPSYRNADGSNEWVLSGEPGEMLNPIHAPDEYLAEENMEYIFLYPADITAENELHYWYGNIVQYVTGLYMTVRLVHPLAPGDISYSIIGPFWWEQQNATITGPAVAGKAGDFDTDGDVDADDIDLLTAEIAAGTNGSSFDVNGDGFVDEADLIEHIATLIERTDGGVGTYRGDFNLDGYVDGTDLAILKAGFGLTGLGYAAGNANADTFVDGTDLAIFKATFGLSGTPGGGNPPAVPGPATIGLLSLGAMALLRRR
jgi:hypothetical protein